MISPYIPLVLFLLACLVFGAPLWVWIISVVIGYILALILIFVLGVSGAGYSMSVDQVALKAIKDLFKR